MAARLQEREMDFEEKAMRNGTCQEADGDCGTSNPLSEVCRWQEAFEAHIGDRQQSVINAHADIRKHSRRRRIDRAFNAVKNRTEDTTRSY